MKKLVTLSICLALAACSEAEAPVEETDDTAAMAEETAAPMAATAPEPGLYEVTMADGATSQTRLNADGTFVDIVDGAESATGTWRWADGQMCFDGDEEGVDEVCYTDGPPAADGSWTVTGPDGTTATVRQIEVDAGTEMAPAE